MAHYLRTTTLVQHPSRTISIVLCLGAYAVALAAGLAVGNDAATVLWRGLVVFMIAQLVAPAIGRAAETAIREHLRDHLARNAVPSLAQIQEQLDGPIIEVGEDLSTEGSQE